jgi:hypothetical protein
MNTPVIGEVWKSKTLTGRFLVLSGPECVPGQGAWSRWVFVGHKAKRTSDGALALVALTKKPKDYPYDWVLI